MLRKGRWIGTVDVKDSSPEELAEMMVGRKVDFTIQKQAARPGETVLSVENLVAYGYSDKKAVDNVSFTVRAGEIVCVAGIEGNGQSELVYALTGLMPSSGRVELNGQPIDSLSIRGRNNRGLAHIPEDRHKHGLVLDYDLKQNLSLKRYLSDELQHGGFIRFDRVRSHAQRLIERYDIRSAQGPDTSMRSMSGGNQQKAIVAREIDTNPELLIAVQPTRGLDVGAMLYIHEQLVRLRDEGKAILLISLELDEVFQLADRILVIFDGQLVAELQAGDVSQEELGLYMAGSKRQEVRHA